MPNEQRIRTVCGLEGYEHVWIEYDVSKWGLGLYYDLYADLTRPQIITEFIPRHSVAWHMESRDGTVIPHPGQGATDIVWRSTWRQFDRHIELGRTVFPWLTVSVFQAMSEAMALPPKSPGNDSSISAAAEVPVVGGEGSQTA